MVKVGFARCINDPVHTVWPHSPEKPCKYELVLDVFIVDDKELDARNHHQSAYYGVFWMAAMTRGVQMSFWTTGNLDRGDPHYLIFIE